MLKEGYETVIIVAYFSCMRLITVRPRPDQAYSRLPRSQIGWF